VHKSIGFLIALAALTLGAAQTVFAQDAFYVVSYFEAMPATQNEVAALARAFGEESRKEDGNLRFDVMQRIGQTNHFSIVEVWKDAKARTAHASAAGTGRFREKLVSLLRSPYDERPHNAFNVGALQAAGANNDTVYAVTHVDFIPPEKENGLVMVKALSEASRVEMGNLRFESLQQANRPNHLTLFEVWKDYKTVETHGVAPHTKQFREKLAPASGALFDERFYKSIN
jgi:quinol monooxygenase YgiN